MMIKLPCPVMVNIIAIIKHVVIFNWKIRPQLVKLIAGHWLEHWTVVSFCLGTLQQCASMEPGGSRTSCESETNVSNSYAKGILYQLEFQLHELMI